MKRPELKSRLTRLRPAPAFEPELARFARWSRTKPLVRVPATYGWTRSAHVLAAVIWLAFLANAGLVVRPDLLYPDDIGSDSANYVAAAERLASNGSIYAIRAGDRPVPKDNAPDWTAPIISPPTVPALLLPTVLAPSDVRPYIVWSIGLAGTIAAGLYVALTAPAWVLAVTLLFAPGLAATAWSGNTNAIVAGSIPLVYLAGSARDRRLATAGGALLGLLALLKIGPLMLIPWLAGRRAWVAVASAVVTVLVGLAYTGLIAGLPAFEQFNAVARESVAQPSTWSIPALALRLGLPNPLPLIVLTLVLALIALYAIRFARSPSAFVLDAIGATIATTIVRVEGIAVASVAAVAYSPDLAASGGAVPSPRWSAGRVAVWAGIGGAAAALAWSVGTGGLRSSSMTITNNTASPVVVRFGVTSQAASFGYIVEPGASVTAWRDGGGSARSVYAWTADCELMSETVVPRTGGHVTVTDTGLQLEAESRRGLPLAEPQVACSAALKARLESVTQRLAAEGT